MDKLDRKALYVGCVVRSISTGTVVYCMLQDEELQVLIKTLRQPFE